MRVIYYYAGLLMMLIFLGSNLKSRQSEKRMIHLPDFSSDYIQSRNVDVWLPAGYFADKSKHYPVLYMHDGQNLFEDSTSYIGVSWGLDETMEELTAKGQVQEAIVVGIWNTPNRFMEYMPEAPLEYLDKEIKSDLTGQTGDILSDEYLKFLVKELKPYIDKRYRTKPDHLNTYIMGSSMGGLISWYALTQYPEVFGGAGCLSTHWPAGSKEVDDPVFQAMKSYFRDSFPRAGNHKIYFDYGTETLDSLYEPFQNEMDQVVRNLGYVEGDDWMTRKFPGHEHSERAWGKRLHIPVKFLLGK